jgi:hypothetical protein
MKIMVKNLLLVLVVMLTATQASAWGFWAHKRINRMAVFTLPPEMLGLYKRHIAYLTEKATAPDMRRYAVQGEAYRHYIDIDKWGTYPFEDLPRQWSEIQEQYWELWVQYQGDSLRLTGKDLCIVNTKHIRFFGDGVYRLFGKDSLLLDRKDFSDFCRDNYPYGSMYEAQALDTEALNTFLGVEVEKAWLVDPFTEHGVLPYEFPRQVRRLTRAFEEGNLRRILRLSADIGHYVGDAHVPLHTTMNYNGQLTNQKGIHGFWESRIPELFAENYDFLVGKAEPVPWPEDLIWEAVLESHGGVDSVLSMERELSERFPDDKKYGYESRNNVVVRAYSREYSKAYSDMLDGMIERRMRRSIERLGIIWYTAWVKAGKPDLGPLYDAEMEEENEKYEKKLKIIDREAQGFGFNRMFKGEPYKVKMHNEEVKSQKGIAGFSFLLFSLFVFVFVVR